VVRADGAELSEAACFVPGEEPANREALGRARVGVARVGGEKGDEAQCRRRAGSGDHRRHQHRSSRLETIVKFVTLRPVTMPSLIAPAFAHMATRRFSLCSSSLI